MKAYLLLAVSGLVGIVASTPLASMDNAMELATFTHERYLNQTCRKLQLFLID